MCSSGVRMFVCEFVCMFVCFYVACAVCDGCVFLAFVFCGSVASKYVACRNMWLGNVILGIKMDLQSSQIHKKRDPKYIKQ